MESNTLAKYMGQNLKGIISSINVVQGTAKDSGNTYYCIEMGFINGYKKRLYLRAEEQFAWVNAFETLNVSKQFNIDEE